MRLLRSVLVVGGAALLVVLSAPYARATSDPFWTRQYGPQQIGAPAAWARSTGKDIKVAVVDSGVDVNHPDLKANLDLADSYDFACKDADPNDDAQGNDGAGKPAKGHGTHVTGIIAAVANNNIGIAGVAPDVKVMVEKVQPTDPSCTSGGSDTFSSGAAMAIKYAVDHGAKVINLSIDDSQRTSLLTGNIQKACNDAFSSGTLCVVAAGNSGETQPSGYSKDFNGIVVTANDSEGRHADFGQKADTKWSVSAPGVAVLSTWPTSDRTQDGYASLDGTSMATPHVSGAAAVLFGMGMSAKQVAEKLVATAGPPRDSLVEGAGMIHLDKAAGVETVATTSAADPTAGGGGVVRSGRAGVAGGSGAVAVTTTIPTATADGPSSAFEEGITEDASKNFDQLRLKEASKNSAGKPFNAAGPLAGLSAIGAVVLAAFAIPRLRSKDTPLT